MDFLCALCGLCGENSVLDRHGERMKIGLISDTHIREPSERLHEKVREVFQGVDLILHAGDIYNPSVLDELERMAPVLAAAGDDD